MFEIKKGKWYQTSKLHDIISFLLFPIFKMTAICEATQIVAFYRILYKTLDFMQRPNERGELHTKRLYSPNLNYLTTFSGTRFLVVLFF